MGRMLVGRDAECAALSRALAAAEGRPTPVVLVSGESGAGKTTLVEHVLARTGVPVLSGRAAEWAGAAYDVLARALRPAVRDTAGPVPTVLAQIFPERGAPPATADLAALAAGVCSVLGRLAAGRPLALFLDDLQWADQATLGLLPALADAAGDIPVMLVGCYRSDELPRDHRLRAVRAQLRRSRQLAEIDVGPLDDEDVARMLTHLLGAKPGPALVAAVASRAEGIPFAVEELALALRDGGAGAALVPDGIREAVLLRTARLSGQERTLLETAAVAGQEFDIDPVLAVCGLPAWPDGFTGAGLLTEVRDGRAAFRHSLTHEAAYADIGWSRRRDLHRELARTLAAGGAVPALIARHQLAARDFEAAREALIAAADAYCAVHAYRDAARALRTVLEHWPADTDDDGRLAVVGQLARCAEMCSEYAEAVTLLRELADGHERRGEAGPLAVAQRRLALVHELRGQWEAALTAREAAAVAFSAAGLRAEAAIDRLAVAAHLRVAGSYSAALGTLATARADTEDSGRTDLLLRAEGLRGNLLARLGQSREGVAVVRAALDQALAASLTDTAADLQQRLADSLEHAGDYRAATAVYAAAFQYCDAHGADAVGQLCRACATVVLFTRGEWDRTAVVCEDVLASAATPHARGAAAGMLGLVHAMRGAARQARPHLLESHLIATRIELVPMELFSSWGLCVLESSAGSCAEAADRARRMLARLAGTQERHFSVLILQWMAAFFAEQGMDADVRACAAALAGMAETTGQPEAIAALAHARGETLLADEPEAALRELRRAAEKFGELELPYATAQAQRRAAGAAARIGDKTAAVELLHAAHDTAGRLGARVLRTACAAALGELGGKPRPPVAGRGARGIRAAGGLTGRELEIMLLVARGNTSRKIGEALFISPRTVEMHVQGVLVKLGCRTRAQAVRKLAELGTLPPEDTARSRPQLGPALACGACTVPRGACAVPRTHPGRNGTRVSLRQNAVDRGFHRVPAARRTRTGRIRCLLQGRRGVPRVGTCQRPEPLALANPAAALRIMPKHPPGCPESLTRSDVVSGTSPVARQRELGTRLRALRNERGMTVEEVAAELLCSTTKISRLETAARRPSLRDVRDLCLLYEVDEPTAQELMTLAREAREPGWWTQYDDLDLDPLVGLEQEATAITCYSMSYMPGLLQTAEYAQGIIQTVAPKMDPQIVHQRAKARLRRQQLLAGDDPPRLHVLLDEVVFHRGVGGPAIMTAQLDKVLKVLRNGEAVVQVVPFSAGAYAAMDGYFTLLEFSPDSELWPVVFVEGLSGNQYLERRSDIDRYRETIDYLRNRALDPGDSADLIVKIHETYVGR